jgi:hypothetical protein
MSKIEINGILDLFGNNACEFFIIWDVVLSFALNFFRHIIPLRFSDAAATIVTEGMSAGSYSKQWNAANVSSGIYYYRLRAGTYIETKKLVLLK